MKLLLVALLPAFTSYSTCHLHFTRLIAVCFESSAVVHFVRNHYVPLKLCRCFAIPQQGLGSLIVVVNLVDGLGHGQGTLARTKLYKCCKARVFSRNETIKSSIHSFIHPSDQPISTIKTKSLYYQLSNDFDNTTVKMMFSMKFILTALALGISLPFTSAKVSSSTVDVSVWSDSDDDCKCTRDLYEKGNCKIWQYYDYEYPADGKNRFVSAGMNLRCGAKIDVFGSDDTADDRVTLVIADQANKNDIKLCKNDFEYLGGSKGKSIKSEGLLKDQTAVYKKKNNNASSAKEYACPGPAKTSRPSS